VIGGLIGISNPGRIDSCSSTCRVVGTNCIGGLVGENNFCDIQECSATSVVEGIPTETEYASSAIGGLVGFNRYSLSFCQSYGSVNGYSYVGGLAGINDYGDSIILGCHTETSVYGDSIVGGIVGENRGNVISCYANGTVTGGFNSMELGGICGRNTYHITRCVSAGPVIGGDCSTDFGGLCGTNYGSICDCASTATVSSGSNTGNIGGISGSNDGWISECTASGPITGGYESWNLGGLCGLNKNNIYGCYATGPVTGGDLTRFFGGLCGCNGGTIEECYATSRVVGGIESFNAGGLCGDTASGVVKQCYWDIQTSEMPGSSGGIGITTPEMKIKSTFTGSGWDFLGESKNGNDDSWRMCKDGIDYPRLWWEFERDGDFDCPDGVDVRDLMILTENWLDVDIYRNIRGDATGDHRVGLEDLAIVSAGWLSGIPEIPRSRVAYWAMDDNSPGKWVADSGGGNYHGTAKRDTAAMAVEGRVGGALGFDGVSDHIDCGTEAGLLPEAWTVCAWVKCNDTASPTLISFGGTYPAVKLQQNGKGKPLIYLGPYNYRYFDAGAWTTLKDGQWHHVAFVVPGAAQSDIEAAAMYLDGRPVAAGVTTSSVPQAGKTWLLLGINATAGGQRFSGAMDEVMLFNRALTAGEIGKMVGQ
jgi:hypothetical protein